MGAKTIVCLPGSGPGVSDTCRPFEIARVGRVDHQRDVEGGLVRGRRRCRATWWRCWSAISCAATGAAGATPIRVCATPDKIGLTAFALAAAEQQVAFFNRLLRHPVSVRKARHHRRA